jgi:hypothetical protein
MSKSVGQPGDAVYTPSRQAVRHTNYFDRTGAEGGIYIHPQGGGGSGGGGGGATAGGGGFTIDPMILMYSNTPKVDISLEPIACDEPIAPANFPPLPDHIQLPVGPISTWSQAGGGGRGGGGGYAGGGGGSPGVISPVVSGVHQHYMSVVPGTYALPHGGTAAPAGGGGGVGYAADPDAAVPGYNGSNYQSMAKQNLPGGVLPQHGYYKCTPVASPNVATETFNSNSGGSGAGGGGGGRPSTPPPRYTGASSKDLDKLGQAPKLESEQDKASAPEAPQAALVSQSQAVDLSLPDDEFVSRYGLQDSGAKRFAKAVGRRVGTMVNQGVNAATSRVWSAVP